MKNSKFVTINHPQNVHIVRNVIIAITLVISMTQVDEVKFAYANGLPEVPEDVIGLNRTLLIEDALNAADIMLDISGNVSIDLQEYIRQLFMATWRTPIIDASTMHQYHSYEEKLISGGSKVNHSDCNDKLKYLVARVNEEQADGRSMVDLSTDYRLFNLLDSYGRPEGSFVRGVAAWLGDYDQCITAKYSYSSSAETSSNSLTGSRYCLAHLRWPNWRHTEGFNEWKYSTVKSAICIPESCDSLAAETEENKQLIYKLMEVNFSPAYKGYRIGDIYCLPDKESPLTQWQYDLPATCVLVFFTVWIMLIVVASLLDMYGSDKLKLSQASFVEIFSFQTNAQKLFNLTSDRSDELARTKEEKNEQPINAKQQEAEKGAPSLVMVSQKHQTDAKVTKQVAYNDNVIDLNYLHCVKVICLFIVMKTHFFLFLTPIVRASDMVKAFPVFSAYHLLLGAMGVNNFFIITGAIISYVIFTKFPAFNTQQLSLSNSSSGKQRTHPILQPAVWLAFCTSRYLRIMPMWVVVTLVAKYLAKYIGSGPCWDYGTSTQTNMAMCREESWLYTLLAAVNLRPEYQNCVPSAWYLAIDLQCTIVLAPIIIIAYLKVPRVAFLVSVTSPVLHYIHYIGSDVYIPELVRGLTRFGLGSFASLSVFGHELNKIYHYTPARATYFLMGITAGYALHIYEISIKNSQALEGSRVKFIVNIVNILKRPILSNWLTVTLMFTGVFSPMIAVPHLPEQYQMLYSGTAAVYYCLGLMVCLYAYLFPIFLIQLAIGTLGSSNGSKVFLNWTGWLPFSRISLTFLLLDPLIVLIFNGRLEHTLLLNLDTHVFLMIAQSVIIYIISILVFIAVESPMKSCLTMAQKKLLRRYGGSQLQ